MSKTLKRVLVTIAVLVAISATGACGFLAGVLADRVGAIMPSVTIPAALPGGGKDLGSLMDQVERLVKGNALEPSSDDSMTTNAIRGLLNSLGDPYSAYLDPKGFKEFNLDSKGEFFGIGISVQINDKGQPFVVQPFAGSPAARAGLKAGDVITAINGARHPKWDIDVVVSKIRGPKGTKVKLEITRLGLAKPFSVTVVRDKIVVPNVMSKMVKPGVGYVRLMQFNEQAATQVRDALRTLDKKGAKGFILDLRENPGGLLMQAVDVTSLFVADGVVVRVDERGKPEQELRATGAVATNKPLVVLIDHNAASASEIVAAALKDFGRATLVGETTFGKGSVQTVLDLNNGGAIKITTAHYLSPKRRVINKRGVTPDVVVKMDPKLEAKESTDLQLQRAIAELEKLLSR